MVVYHFCDYDGSYQGGINTTIGTAWNWVVIRYEHQPKLTVNVNGVLLIPIAN